MGLRTPRPCLNHAGRARVTGCVPHNIGDRQSRLSDVGARYQRGWGGAREPDRLLVLAAGDAPGAREGALEGIATPAGAFGALVVRCALLLFFGGRLDEGGGPARSGAGRLGIVKYEICDSMMLEAGIGVALPKVVEYGVEKGRAEGMGRGMATEAMVAVQRSRLQNLVECRGGSDAGWRG